MSISLALCHEHGAPIHRCPRCAATVPPAAGDGAEEFEADVRRDGEHAARWERLMKLLEERDSLEKRR